MAVWSTVNLSEVQARQRFDSDYWQPAYMENQTRLSRLDCVTIGDATTFVRCGPFGSNLLCENYVPDGVLVVRPFNLKNFTVERENLAYVSEEVCKASRLGFYSEGDIMFARVGDVRAGVLRSFSLKVTISPNVIAARMNHNGLNPYYVTAFMNCRFGMAQLLRGVKTVAQPTITVELVKEARVPCLSKDFQNAIADLVKESISKDDDARHFHETTEANLDSTLGLDRVDLAPRLFYEGRFLQVSAAGRFDAEHFQPRYVAVLDGLRKCRNVQVRALKELCG